MSKNKLDDSWYQPNTLVWLEGGFHKVKKTDVKATLDKLGIKYTNKLAANVTHVLTTNWNYLDRPSWRSNNDPIYAHILTLPKTSVLKPADFIQHLRNETANDMSEFTNQILTLLKTNDVNNITLAITLIGDSLIEEDWIPWLLLNKDKVNDVKPLLHKNNISPGQFHPNILRQSIQSMLYDVRHKLKVPEHKIIQFIKDYFDTLENKI